MRHTAWTIADAQNIHAIESEFTRLPALPVGGTGMQVWVMNADGTGATEYTHKGKDNDSPDWGTAS